MTTQVYLSRNPDLVAPGQPLYPLGVPTPTAPPEPPPSTGTISTTATNTLPPYATLQTEPTFEQPLVAIPPRTVKPGTIGDIVNSTGIVPPAEVPVKNSPIVEPTPAATNSNNNSIKNSVYYKYFKWVLLVLIVIVLIRIFK